MLSGLVSGEALLPGLPFDLLLPTSRLLDGTGFTPQTQDGLPTHPKWPVNPLHSSANLTALWLPDGGFRGFRHGPSGSHDIQKSLVPPWGLKAAVSAQINRAPPSY